MDPLTAYIPQDRRLVIARGEMLPEHPMGVALFTDISGFTPLTEALTAALGPRRGAEALTIHLNQVYDTMIGEVERYSGSVLSFAGDAIICWFDEADGTAPLRAVACAIALHQAMASFHAIVLPSGLTIGLALKTALAGGLAHRFVVGNPAIQLIDSLAGPPIVRTALAEQLAKPGDILLDQTVTDALESMVQILERRIDPDTEEQFAVIAHQITADPQLVVSQQHPSPATPPVLTPEHLRPWLLPVVYERERAGHGDWLTEFRPAVALFLRFQGWDDERLPERAWLNTFFEQAQTILMRYQGNLLQVNIGDKGSYFYAAFGAPLAHENDPQRAVKAALALRQMAREQEPPIPVQIGISRGTMRAGAYGGRTRRTYGIIGDDVNLAARLMQTAAIGEILVSSRVQQALVADPHARQTEGFTLEPRPPVVIKGKVEPQSVFAVTGTQRRRAIRLQEPAYTLPMVGRATELHVITQQMERAIQGQGQIVGISAEAGMGKSRLIAEVIRLGWRRHLTGYGGACQSDGLTTSYLVWRPIFSALFDLDPLAPMRKQVRMLESALAELAPTRMESLPLLEAVLGIALSENTFTQALTPQFRKSALEALLIDCLQAAAREEGGLLLVLEDLHWIDPASYDLLEQVARSCTTWPIFILLAYRPHGEANVVEASSQIAKLPNWTPIALADLTADEMEQAIRAKLAQLYPERNNAIPPALIDQVVVQAQGNPFYLEELLNYIRDRGIDFWRLSDMGSPALDLPASLHSLILSRIDQLSARQQLTLKVASVIGRAFRFGHLRGFYPELDNSGDLKRELDVLNRLDLTPLESPEPELIYLFKHIVTREVAYESLTYATRAFLHEQYASYLEAQAGTDIEYLVHVLAYHYDRTEHLQKRQQYLRQAGEAAARRYANTEALDYLSRALAITTDLTAQFQLIMTRVTIFHRQGNREAQRQDLEHLRTIAALLNTLECQAEVALQYAIYTEAISDYLACIQVAQQAVALGEAAGMLGVVCDARRSWAFAHQRQGDYSAARQQAELSLALARQIGDRWKEAYALHTAGVVATHQNRNADAQALFEQGLEIARDLSDRLLESRTLNSLGILAYEQGDFVRSRDYYERSLRLAHEMGDRYGEVTKLMNLGALAGGEGDYHAARNYSEQALQIARAIDDRQGECTLLGNLGGIALWQGAYTQASAYYQHALQLSQGIGARELEAWALWGMGNVALLTDKLDAADHAYQQAAIVQRELGAPVFLAEILAGLARTALAKQALHEAHVYVDEIMRFLEDHTLEGAEEAPWVYLTCYQVLRAQRDSRAGTMLETGYALLQERMARFHSTTMQERSVQIPYHQELIKAWNTSQTSQD